MTWTFRLCPILVLHWHRCQCCHVDNGRAAVAVASANRIHRQPKREEKKITKMLRFFFFLWEEGGGVVLREERVVWVSWQPFFPAACSSPLKKWGENGRQFPVVGPLHNCSHHRPLIAVWSLFNGISCSVAIFGDPAGRRKAVPGRKKKGGFY